MSKVFVLDTNKQPLNPVHAGRARLLLKQGKAAIYRRYPFSIILKRAVEQPDLHPPSALWRAAVARDRVAGNARPGTANHASTTGAKRKARCRHP